MGPARAARDTPRERGGRVRDAGERASRPRLGPARARLPRALPRRALVRRALRGRAGRDAGRLRARRAVRAHAGTTTSEVRQRGERLYQVEIAYGCTRTRVRVRAEDGRIGTVAGPQLQCCREGSRTRAPGVVGGDTHETDESCAS